MPRNISFSMTTPQVRARQKTVTRRLGWWFLNPGDILQPIEKGQGLKKGEHVTKIGGLVRVKKAAGEPLNKITRADCRREGFPDLSPAQFVEMFCRHNRCEPTEEVNRIEFEYL